MATAKKEAGEEESAAIEHWALLPTLLQKSLEHFFEKTNS